MAKAELTPRLVETLPVEEGRTRTVYFDTHRAAPKGFALRVTIKGARTYYLLKTNKATKERVWIRIDSAHGLALDHARRAAQACAGEVALGKNPNQDARAAQRKARAERIEKAIVSEEWTVVDMLNAYRTARIDAISPVTAGEYRRAIDTDIAPSELGTMRAREVVRDDVRRVIARIAKRAPAVAGAALTLLRAAFRWAMDEEQMIPTTDGGRVRRPRIERDPTRRIENDVIAVKGAARKVRTRFMSDEEIAKFWGGLDQLDATWATLPRMILLCGTRLGETYKARWRDMELDGPSPAWRIPAEHRKGRVAGERGERRALTVPLSPLAVQLLRWLRPVTAKRERVFVAQGISEGQIGGEVRRVSGVKIAPHDIRRTTASGLQRLGAPPHVISIVLGHAREAGATPTDANYTHDPRAAEHRAWLEKWSSHVERLVSGHAEHGTVVTGEFGRRS